MLSRRTAKAKTLRQNCLKEQGNLRRSNRRGVTGGYTGISYVGH